MWTYIAGWDVRDHYNNNSLSRWRNWELARLRDLTHTRAALRGRAQLFGQCPKCLTTKICRPQNNRTYTLDLYCNSIRVVLLLPFHRFKTWDSEKINCHRWRAHGKGRAHTRIFCPRGWVSSQFRVACVAAKRPQKHPLHFPIAPLEECIY